MTAIRPDCMNPERKLLDYVINEPDGILLSMPPINI
jgi:hypothetical protein